MIEINEDFSIRRRLRLLRLLRDCRLPLCPQCKLLGRRRLLDGGEYGSSLIPRSLSHRHRLGLGCLLTRSLSQASHSLGVRAVYVRMRVCRSSRQSSQTAPTHDASQLA